MYILHADFFLGDSMDIHVSYTCLKITSVFHITLTSERGEKVANSEGGLTSATELRSYYFFIFFPLSFSLGNCTSPTFSPNFAGLDTPRASEKLASRLGRQPAPAGLRGGERAARGPKPSPSADGFRHPAASNQRAAKLVPDPY